MCSRNWVFGWLCFALVFPRQVGAWTVTIKINWTGMTSSVSGRGNVADATCAYAGDLGSYLTSGSSGTATIGPLSLGCGGCTHGNLQIYMDGCGVSRVWSPCVDTVDGATATFTIDGASCSITGSSPPPTLTCCNPGINWTNTSPQWIDVGIGAYDSSGHDCWEYGQPGFNVALVGPGGIVSYPAGIFCQTNCCPVSGWRLIFQEPGLGYGLSNMNIGPGTIQTNTPPVITPPIAGSPPGSGGGPGSGPSTNTTPIGYNTNAATVGSVQGVASAIVGVGQDLSGMLNRSNVSLGMFDGLSGFWNGVGGAGGSNILSAIAKSNVWVLNQTNLERWQSNTLWAITSSPAIYVWATNLMSTNGVANSQGWEARSGYGSNYVTWASNAWYYGTNTLGNALTNFGQYADQVIGDGSAAQALVGADTSGAGDLSYGVFGVIHWDNVFNGSVLDNPSLAWTPQAGGNRGADLAPISGIKNLFSLMVAWGIVIGCLVWYGDAVRDALLEGMSGSGVNVGSSAAGIANQIPGVTLGLRALLTLLIVALLVFLPTVLCASSGSLALALGWSGSGDVISAVAQGATAHSPFHVSWPVSVSRILGVINTWLPVTLMIVAGVNLVAARFTFVWRVPMYVFVSRMLWSI